MAFYVKYLFVAALLGAAVWFGVPEIKAQLEAKPASAPAPAAAPAAVPAAPAPQAAPERTRQPSIASDSTAAEGNRPQPSAPAAAPAAQTAQAVYEEAPAEPVQQPGYTGPRYDWGVLAEEAQTYGEDGKIRVKLPAGSVVEKMEEKNSSNGRMYVCRVLLNRRWQPGFVLKASAVVMFAGPFADAPKAPSDKVIRYFQLQGFIEARTAVLREEHLKSNPYFNAYKKAATDYTEFQDKVKKLTADRDSAQGMARSKIASELDRLRTNETKLRTALEKAEGPYKKWKDQHGDGYDTVMNDENIAKWSAEMQDLRPEVSEMVPGV